MGSGDDSYLKRGPTGKRGTQTKTDTGRFSGHKVRAQIFAKETDSLIVIDAPVKFPITGLWVPASVNDPLEPNLEEAYIRTTLDNYCAMCLNPTRIPELRARYELTGQVKGTNIDIAYIDDGKCVIGPPTETQTILEQTLDQLISDFPQLRWLENARKPMRIPKAFASFFKEDYRKAERIYLWDGEQIR